jgi:hypothetical protein
VDERIHLLVLPSLAAMMGGVHGQYARQVRGLGFTEGTGMLPSA